MNERLNALAEEMRLADKIAAEPAFADFTRDQCEDMARRIMEMSEARFAALSAPAAPVADYASLLDSLIGSARDDERAQRPDMSERTRQMRQRVLRLAAIDASIASLAAPAPVAAHPQRSVRVGFTQQGEPMYANILANLWCLHLRGPDEVHAAPSKEAAEAAAAYVLKWEKGTLRDDLPKVGAVAAPWPWSPESHAEDLKQWTRFAAPVAEEQPQRDHAAEAWLAAQPKLEPAAPPAAEPVGEWDPLEAMRNTEANLASLFESGDWGISDDVTQQGFGILEDLRNAIAAAPASPPGEVDAFLSEVRAELMRARAKFPGDRIMTIALAEEFGELCKAILDEPAANVRKEAVQTAVMAARVVLDGDGSVNDWRNERGLDALVRRPAASEGGEGNG